MRWHDAPDVILHEPAHGQQSVLQDLEFIVEVAVHDGAPDGGRPTVRFRLNPRLLAGRHDQSRRPPKNRQGLSP